jgi:hypothetical protein
MLRDFRYALRTLRQNPGFALVAIISLALGIGANAAIYSFADALLLRPMAVPHASQVMAVQSQMLGEAIGGLAGYVQVSYPDYRDLRGSGVHPFWVFRDKGSSAGNEVREYCER